jgi:hypothetical protein
MKRFKQILFFTALSCGLYLTACQKEAASPSSVTKQTLVKGVAGIKKDTIIVTRTIQKDTIIVTRADEGK